MHEVHAQIYMKRYTKMYIIVNKLEIKSSFTQWRRNDFVAVLY